jgi:hypothetical protein
VSEEQSVLSRNVESDCIESTDKSVLALGYGLVELRAGFRVGGLGLEVGVEGGGGPRTRGTGDGRVVAQSSAYVAGEFELVLDRLEDAMLSRDAVYA